MVDYFELRLALFETLSAHTGVYYSREETHDVVDVVIEVLRAAEGREPLGTMAEPVGSLQDAADRVAEWLGMLEGLAGMSLQADDLRRLVDHAREPQDSDYHTVHPHINLRPVEEAVDTDEFLNTTDEKPRTYPNPDKRDDDDDDGLGLLGGAPRW